MTGVKARIPVAQAPTAQFSSRPARPAPRIYVPSTNAHSRDDFHCRLGTSRLRCPNTRRRCHADAMPQPTQPTDAAAARPSTGSRTRLTEWNQRGTSPRKKTKPRVNAGPMNAPTAAGHHGGGRSSKVTHQHGAGSAESDGTSLDRMRHQVARRPPTNPTRHVLVCDNRVELGPLFWCACLLTRATASCSRFTYNAPARASYATRCRAVH